MGAIFKFVVTNFKFWISAFRHFEYDYQRGIFLNFAN